MAETKVITGKCRLSFVNIFKPVVGMDGGEPKYSVCLLIPKTDKATVKKIKDAVEAAKADGISLWGGKVPGNLKTPLRDGDAERADRPEYAGMYFMNVSSKKKPGVVDANRNDIDDESEVYSGCYGRASINFYAYSNRSKGVGAGLNNIQKIADGERFGGGANPSDDFSSGYEEGLLD
jgi:hypothetical protein